MLGQFVLMCTFRVMPAALRGADVAPEAPAGREAESHLRSGLSGLLILLSLGGVMSAPIVWLMPVDAVWKSFFSVLFVVALVTILIWITDRYDDTVTYLRSYTRGRSPVLGDQASGPAPHPGRAAL